MFYTPGSADILAGRDAGAPRYKLGVFAVVFAYFPPETS
jgi:hypothetical protein